MLKRVAFVLLLILNVASLVYSLSYEEDTRISGQERDALNQFKAKVIPKVPKSSYIQNYIRDDLYWIHWLRAKRFNIRQAEDLFLNHLKWREQWKIDTIHLDNLDDWAEFDKSYPSYFNDTVDKTGRPIVEFWVGDWNLRQAALAGQIKQSNLGLGRFCEMGTRRVFKARAEGKKVSQAQILCDLGNFNLVQVGCAACLPVFVTWTNVFQNQYPFLFDNTLLLNMPQSFGVVLRLVSPIFNDYIKGSIKYYSGRAESLKVLDELVDRSQRSVRLGGTIVRDRD